MKYKTIAADPPWPEKKSVLWGRQRAADVYPLMTVEEICKLPVGQLGDENSHLWLWTTARFIDTAIREVVPAYGFEYKGIVTCCKMQLGVGRYLRTNTEFLVFAARNNMITLHKGIPTWFTAPRGKHSVKPEESYRIIELASPPPRIELFARKPRSGWDVWGLDVESDITLEASE